MPVKFTSSITDPLGFVGQQGSVKSSYFQSSIYNKRSLPVTKLQITVTRFQTSDLELGKLLKMDLFPPSHPILISLCRGVSLNLTPKSYLQPVSYRIS